MHVVRCGKDCQLSHTATSAQSHAMTRGWLAGSGPASGSIKAGLPPASQPMSSYGKADFADAFLVDLPEAASHDAEFIARHIFDHQPEWIAALLNLRDLRATPVGIRRAVNLQAAGGDRINIFRIFGRYPNEIARGGRRASEFPRVGARAAAIR